MLYSQNYPSLTQPISPPASNLITHDHKGRKLSPALSNLLSSTIIPKPRRKVKKSSSRPQFKLRTDSNSSTDSTDSGTSAITCNSSCTTSSTISSPDNLAISISSFSSSILSSSNSDSFLSVASISSESHFRISPIDDDHTSSTLNTITNNETSTSDNGEDETNDEHTWQGAFKDSIAALKLIGNNNSSNSTSSAVPIPKKGKISYIQRWIEDNGEDVDVDGENELVIGSIESTNSIGSDGSTTSISNARRNKITIPTFEASVEDHPLRRDNDDEESMDTDSSDLEGEVEVEGEEHPHIENKSRSMISKTKRLLAKKSLVSNLTASFKAISSMASSLSNSQQMQTTNYLSFGPRLMDEPHPSKLLVISRPATQAKLKPVLLKTYNIQSTLIPGVRPREVRMNSDFYRIYAVELLMKMNGKIDEKFVGRAQMILEPRQDNNSSFQDEVGGEEVFGIRKRFVSSFDTQDRSSKRRYVPTSNLAYATSINDF